MSIKSPKTEGNLQFQRAARIASIALAITVIFSYLDLSTHVLDYFEQQMYGDRLQVSGLVHPELTERAASQMQVVAITDDTYRWAAHGGAADRFIPRRYYAKLIDKLSGYGAKVIAFDVLLDAKDSGDAALAAAAKRSGRVLLACGDAGDSDVEVTYPESRLINAGCKLGHSRVLLSVDRPAIDQIEPFVTTVYGWMPALSVEAVRMARGLADVPVRAADGVPTIPGLPIVANYSGDRRTFKIHYLYLPPPGPGAPESTGEAFSTIPLERILAGNRVSDQVYRAVFRNKIVLIGDTTKIGHDRYLTPLETMPGVVIQANATATVLDDSFIKEAPARVEVLSLALTVTFITILSSLWPLRRVAALIVLILPLSALINVWLFVEMNYYVQLAGPSFAMVVTALSILLERGLAEESEKARMRSLLLRYVNPRIANHILKHPELIGGYGKRQVGTILFSDVRGFTRLSEELTPEELVSRMNEYFQTITEIVFRHDGTAASIVGDAMLAVFGIPVTAINHADQAIAAAIEIQMASKQLREKWKAGDALPLESGIGINTGEVIVGEVGGQHLRNFTVYGLHVNIASRVEALNRDFKTEILLTRSTYEALEKPVSVGPALSVQVKGLVEPIDVFELCGY